MIEFRTKYWCAVRSGGNIRKLRKCKISQPMPFQVFKKFILNYNTKKFNNNKFKMVLINNNNRWTTKLQNGGLLPIDFLKYLLHYGKSLQIYNHNHSLPQYDIIKPLLHYYIPNCTLTLQLDLIINESCTNNLQSIANPYV